MQEILNENDFKQKVLENKKNVLVDFFAVWCGPCKMLTPIVEKISEEKKAELDVYKVDIDQLPDLAAQYSVQGVPTLILFKEGKESATQVGFLSKDALEKWLKKNTAK